MTKPASKTTACVVDTGGLFAEMAATLSKSFAKTYYCTALRQELETPTREAVGQGLGNLTVIASMFDPETFAATDLFVFLDVGCAPEQLLLEGMGKRVWGPRYGDELELDRVLCKELLKHLGCAVGRYEVVTGIAALRKFIPVHPGWFCKISNYRGLGETFRMSTLAALTPRLQDLERQLEDAGRAADFPFCCEAPIDNCVEYGSDMYCIDGEYPDKFLRGLEIKDAGYCGMFGPYSGVDKSIIELEHKLSPTLKKYHYRGFLSYDARIPKGGPVYLTDMCCRCASPPNHLYQVMYSNLAEIVAAGADGELVQPECKYKWGVEALIETKQPEGRCMVKVPKDHAEFVKLRYAMQDAQGNRYRVPMIPSEGKFVGSVLGVGQTLDEARKMCVKIADSIDGDGLKVNVEALDEAEEEAAKAEKMGIKVFG